MRAPPSARASRRSFPALTEYCHTAGIEPSRDLIPVAPRALSHGRRRDRCARSTSLEGLWAAGEVAAPARMAPTTCLELIARSRVYAARIADDINLCLRTAPRAAIAVASLLGGARTAREQALRNLMSACRRHPRCAA